MGTQGIVSSICPQHVAPANGMTTTTDPLFGYNPAVAVIIDKLKLALNNQCLPQPLVPDKMSGVVQCLVLVQMPANNGGTCKNPVCNMTQGLIGPGGTIAAGQTFDQGVLNQYCDNLEAAYQQQVQAAQAMGVMPGLEDPANLSVCALAQLTTQANPGDFPMGGSCSTAKNTLGWCYVTGSATGSNCAFAVVFTPSEPPAGSTANLQCLEQVTRVIDGG
jgi:hypothetical protein